MLEIISALTLAISSNLDNILIGMNYGASKIKIPIKYIIIIGIVISILTYLALIIGEMVQMTIKYSSAISASTLIFIGVLSMLRMLKNKSCESKVEKISYKSSILLALSLSFNNFVIAIASSIGKISVTYAVIFSFIFSTIFLEMGNILGRKINSKIIGVISAILLIVLGIINFLN